MVTVVSKYFMDSTGQLRVPHGAKLIHVNLQSSQLYAWAEVQPTAQGEDIIEFEVVPTGGEAPIGAHWNYFATVFTEMQQVWHVYVKDAVDRSLHLVKARRNDMSDFEIDLTTPINLDTLQQTIAAYNSAYTADFQVTQSGNAYVLSEDEGQDVHVKGTLREIACYWEGRISGQLSGQPDEEETL